MSDSDDSDDSGLPFDVEIEKCEKRLQLARYKKKYRNVWNYVTDRWQKKHIHIVLKDIEQKWRVYSAGSHGSIDFTDVSDAFRYLEDVFEDRINIDPYIHLRSTSVTVAVSIIQYLQYHTIHHIF